MFAALSVVTGCSREELNLEQLIERNTNAVGGRAAIEAVQGIEINLHIVDPSFEVDGVYRATRSGKMRIDVASNGKRVFTEGFDGTNGWQASDKAEQKPASTKATAALRHGIELPGKLFGLHELKQRGHRIEAAGREKIDSINYYVLRLILSDGYTMSLLVDPTSWLITRRRDLRPLHVDVDPTPTTIETQLGDFREIAGVKFAFATKEVDLKTGKELERARINSLQVNPSIDQSVFEKL